MSPIGPYIDCDYLEPSGDKQNAGAEDAVANVPMHRERRPFFGVDDVILIRFAHRFNEIDLAAPPVALFVPVTGPLTCTFNSG